MLLTLMMWPRLRATMPLASSRVRMTCRYAPHIEPLASARFSRPTCKRYLHVYANSALCLRLEQHAAFTPA